MPYLSNPYMPYISKVQESPFIGKACHQSLNVFVNSKHQKAKILCAIHYSAENSVTCFETHQLERRGLQKRANNKHNNSNAYKMLSCISNVHLYIKRLELISERFST